MNKYPQITPDNEDFGAILIGAVRYACGRQSYMSGLVSGYVKYLIPYISDKTLCCLERDIRCARGYGNEKIDKPCWMRLLTDLQKEIKARDLERWS
jgi:hypothetical protein